MGKCIKQLRSEAWRLCAALVAVAEAEGQGELGRHAGPCWDYSQFVRGSHIQVRMFSDRLEVENSDGLYGRVTIDKLQEGQSTKNRLLCI